MVNSLRGVNPTGRLDPDVTKRAVLVRTMNLVFLSTLYAIMAELDEDRDNLRPEVRDDYWLFRVPFTSENKMWMALPIPFELGVMTKVLPEAITRQLMSEFSGGKTGSTWQDTKRSMWHAILSTLNFNPTPQAVKPLAQWYFNYDMFTGSPIVPKWEESMPGELQRGMSTSAPAVGVAEVTGMSARKLDNFFRTAFGGVSIYGLQMVDSAIRRTIPGVPSGPSPKLTDFPVFKRFIKDKYGGGLKNEFYEMRNAIDGLVTSINEVSGYDTSKAMEMTIENRELLSVRDTVRNMERKLSEIRNLRTQAFYNNQLTRDLEDRLENQELMILKMVPNLKRMVGSWKM